MHEGDFPRVNPIASSFGGTLQGCRVEPSLADAPVGGRYQFERLGYFCVDPDTSADGTLVFNRTAPLRDSWAKIQKAKK